VTAGHAPYEELSKGEQMAKKSAKKSVKKAAKKTAAKKATKTAKKTAPRKSAAKPKAKKTARKPNAAFMKPLTPSPELAEVVGAKPLPRTEATSALWRYIKKNNLQDAKNKRMIKADPALKAVFGGKSSVNMFEMTKLVSKHLR
jgi:chromatin remodeling complex protein RSC6